MEASFTVFDVPALRRALVHRSFRLRQTIWTLWATVTESVHGPGPRYDMVTPSLESLGPREDVYIRTTL